MKLNLKRPLVVFDLETTGLNAATDRIVQISYIKVMPNGEEEQKTYLVNPEVHIPEACTEVHHITDADVADKETFKELAPRLAKEFEGCDFAGFNSNKFDVPMLVEEFLRAGVKFDIDRHRLIDVQNIYHKKERRTLIAAYRYYCGKDLTQAHSADADTRATYEVLMAQLDKYKDDDVDPIQNDVEWLQSYSAMNRNVDLMGTMIYDEHDVPIFNFGKYKGRPVLDVLCSDPNFYSWVINSQFAQSTKNKLTQLYIEAKKRQSPFNIDSKKK